MSTTLADHAETIARALLGEPNKDHTTKSQLRYGDNGALAIEIAGKKAGTWYDHARETGGGMPELVEHRRSCSRADALEWLASIGIKISARGNGAATEQQHRTAVYIYRDEAGAPLFCVSRWAPLKTFTQERHDAATGKFIGGRGCMNGVRLAPYRLNELVASSSGRIWVTEGEKDCDRLADLGLTATTNPGGAGKWSAGFAQHFAGRDVAVIPDNDPAGQKHARQVIASLAGIAASARLISLPGLPAKGDVSDWLDQGHAVTELEELAETPQEMPDAAVLLEAVHRFLCRFVAYPSPEAAIAHTLWIAHTHIMDAWESTPRIAFLSPEPASGKTRALEITELLVPRPVEAVNVSPAYLFRKVADDDGAPTILFDEIDTIFGPKAKDNEEIRGLLNAGHRRGAVTGRCVVRGKIIETEEIPAYCAVALAGLGWLPDTLLSRSVLIRMRRRAPSEQIEPYRRRVHAAAGHALRTRLEDWAGTVLTTIMAAWPEMPDGVEDRDADVWEPLLAIADAAGGSWPARARAAAVALVAAAKEHTPSLGVRLLADLRAVFADRDAMATADILTALLELDEAPWADLKGKPLNARGLARRLRQYDVTRKLIRIDDWVGRGYLRADLADVWDRYLPPLPSAEWVTSVTKVTNGPKPTAGAASTVTDRVTDATDRVTDWSPSKARKSATVTDVTDVTHSAPGDGDGVDEPLCVHCRKPIQPGDQSIHRDDGGSIHQACFRSALQPR